MNEDDDVLAGASWDCTIVEHVAYCLYKEQKREEGVIPWLDIMSIRREPRLKRGNSIRLEKGDE